jgi:hypothetical protein
MDELARAYATLGVAAGAPPDEVRKRYKALVRQWHPDRFARDPQGQAEAGLRLRAINDAFRTVAAAPVVRADEPAPGAPPYGEAVPRSSPFSGRRLTREEIDRMVESMRNDGPLDWLFGHSWKEELERPVARTRLALYIAVAAWALAPIVADAGGATRAVASLLGLVAAPLALGLALWLLPKRG